MNDELDILVTRVVDGRAGRDDWSALETLAAREPSVWRELALAQRDQALLTEAAERELSVACKVGLPTPEVHVGTSGTNWRRRVSLVGGWAAAAAVTALYVGRVPHGPSDAPQTNTAGVSLADLTTDQARDLYLDRGQKEGRVLSELPTRVLIDSRPAADGRGVQVVYLRQIVERETVSNLNRFVQDERGHLTPVPVRPEALPGAWPAMATPAQPPARVLWGG